MSNHNLEAIFNTHNWDIEEPSAGHEKRFTEKLNAFKPKKKKNSTSPPGPAPGTLRRARAAISPLQTPPRRGRCLLTKRLRSRRPARRARRGRPCGQ